jgi:predicted CXXCH cytochrome family protein
MHFAFLGRPHDRWTGVTKYVLRAFILALILVAASAGSAFAYYENVDPTLPPPVRTGGGAYNPTYNTWQCPDCHGYEDGATTITPLPRSVPSTWTWDSEAGTNVGTRKGPHGGYTTGTQKCATCHTVHDANALGAILMPSATVSEVCFTCHDGTGAGGVYGVIARRGFTVNAAHRIDVTNQVPAGNTNGSTSSPTFNGSGLLTCTDCHSAHNSLTVKPFIGDRLRATNDTNAASVRSNRLLRQRPISSTATATEYGSSWCTGCHQGRHIPTNPMGDHVVADTTTTASWNYNNVVKASGYNTSTVTTGALGGSNFGYVMKDNPRGSQTQPICQQCHEDARKIGDATQFQIDSATESFTPSLDGSTTGNPRFQTFPHESNLEAFVIETYSNLCLNCHVSSSGTWTQTSDADFAGSTLTSTTVSGSGAAASVGLSPVIATIFSDGFESNNFTAGGWTATNWQTTNTTQSAGTFSARGTANTTGSLVKTLNTNAYANPTLTFRYKATMSGAPDYFRLQVNGSTVTTLATSNVTAWTTGTVSLPTSTSVTISFQTSTNLATEWGNLDEVLVTGQSGYLTTGTVLSPTISVARPIDAWTSLTAAGSVPANTTMTFDVLNASLTNTLFSGITLAQMPYALSTIDVTAYPQIRIRANMTGDGTVTPTLNDWSVNYVYLP